MSPLAISTLYRNAVGVKTLLDLFLNDHYRLLATTDSTFVPDCPDAPPDDDVPVILPLYAAVMGPYHIYEA